VTDPLGWLGEHAARREAQGLRRTVTVRDTGDVIDLAGNDYLGLSRHPAVVAAAIEATTTWGTGATGSRLVTGTTPAHVALEERLAAFTGTAAALAFSSGYLANLGAVTALARRGDLVVSDRHAHASLVDAARLSRARVVVTEHADVDAVAKVLADRAEPRALVLTESVFSVDGDLAPLRDLHDCCRTYGAVLLVDEAHALGVVGDGSGAVHAAGLSDQADVVVTVTLSKALGGQGGAVLGSAAVVAHLVDAARTFMFDTGLAPASAAAATAALDVLAATPDLPRRARANARAIAAAARAAGLEVTTPYAAVVSVPMPSPEAAIAAAQRMRTYGVRVGAFRPPSVPDGISRLRLTARAGLSEQDLATVATALRAAG
jgi:8-amino-7-oxononanoate synthase